VVQNPDNVAGHFDIEGSHTYATQASYAISATISLNSVAGGTTNLSSVAIVGTPPLLPVGRTISAAPGIPIPVSTTVASFNTNEFNDANLSDYQASINWGDGNVTPGTLVNDPTIIGLTDINGTNIYAQTGIFPIKVTITHLVDGASAQATGQAIVAAPIVAAPILTAQALTITGTANVALPATTQVASFTDQVLGSLPSDFAATINWGDGNTSAGLIQAVNGSFVVEGSNNYAAANTYKIIVTIVRLSNDQSVTVTSTAVISNPQINVVGRTITEFAGVLDTPTVARFTDTNSQSTPSDFVATIDWGDGHTSLGKITGSDGQFSISGSNAYATSKTYKIAVTVVRTATNQSATGTSSAIVLDDSLTAIGRTFNAPLNQPSSGQIVATFTDSDPNTTAGNFSGSTITWGDGHVTPATVTGGNGQFTVSGGNTYQTAGTYVVTVTIVSNATGLVSTAQASAVVDQPAIAFSGGLTPLSDTGPSNSDGITSNNQPTFSGMAEPFSIIELFAQRGGQGSPVMVAETPAGPTGNWQTMIGPLADGDYTITAIVISPTGVPAPPVLVNPALNDQIVIETAAPQVVGASYNARNGEITAQYEGGYIGMSTSAITNPLFYTLVFGPTARKLPATVSVIPTSGTLPTPADLTGAVVALGLTARQRKLLRGIRIISAGITDLAGNQLNHGNDVVITLTTGGHPGRPVAVVKPKTKR
jgi:hypothetical protein